MKPHVLVEWNLPTDRNLEISELKVLFYKKCAEVMTLENSEFCIVDVLDSFERHLQLAGYGPMSAKSFIFQLKSDWTQKKTSIDKETLQFTVDSSPESKSY